MSSYKLQAKNKETGKIVTVCAIDDYFGNHNYGYSIEDPLNLPEEGYFFRPESLVYSEEKFFQLYDRVDDTTPQWEKEFDEQIKQGEEVNYENRTWLDSEYNKLFEPTMYPESHIEMCPDKVKQFIRDTLKADKMRIMRELLSIEEDPYQDDKTDTSFQAGLKYFKNKVIKLIQNK